MAYAYICLPKPFDFIEREVDAMGEPARRVEPAETLDVVKRSFPIPLDTKGVLVLGLRKMGVEQNILLFCQCCRILH